jgi:outer membrane beta-barrel protein
MIRVKLLTLLTLASLGSSAWAQRRNPLEGQPAIRHMVELRKLRFEVTPQFITSTNQDYRNAFGPGLNMTFHITDWIGIGVAGNYLFNSNTPLENQVRSVLPVEGVNGFMYQYPGPQPSLQIHDSHVLNLNALGSAYVSLTPWHGKFAMFSALFFSYDFFVNAGLGLVNYTQNNCCRVEMHPTPADVAKGNTLPDPNLQDGSQFAGLKIGGMIGVGIHIFFTEWVGLQLELRDYIVKANPGGLDTNGDRVLNSDDEGPQNNLFFGMGITFMLPPSAKISR